MGFMASFFSSNKGSGANAAEPIPVKDDKRDTSSQSSGSGDREGVFASNSKNSVYGTFF